MLIKILLTLLRCLKKSLDNRLYDDDDADGHEWYEHAFESSQSLIWKPFITLFITAAN